MSIWYHPEYAAQGLSPASRIPHVTIDRIEHVVASLDAGGLVHRVDLRRAPSATFEDLARFHTSAHLEDVARPATLGRVFGIEPSVADADVLLRAQRRAVGGTMAAARAAAYGDVRVAVNLGGGFHHADAQAPGPFCVFNDVAVAVAALRAGGWEGRVAVVDLDFHQGDGTVAAFAHDPTVLTYSIQGAPTREVVGERDVQIVLPAGTGDATYLARLRATLPQALSKHQPRLVFLLAGQDVLAGDPLGAFALTRAGVAARDRFAVEAVLATGAAVVILVAGGYGAESWRCLADLVRWLVAGRVVGLSGRPPRRHGRRSRTVVEEAVDAPLLTEAEVGALLWPHEGPSRLGHYASAHTIEHAIEGHGVLAAIRRRGFSDLRVGVDPTDPAGQAIRIHGRKDGRTHLLVEMVLNERALASGPAVERPVRVLAVEWLLVQDPTAPFTRERPALPGQEHPGLGITSALRAFLVEACARLGLDALLSRPAHYHNAVVAARHCHLLDPEAEGRLRAMEQALAGLSLSEGSRIVEQGGLKTEDGAVVAWQPTEQVLPVGPELKEYFDSPAYRARSAAARDALLAAGLGVPRQRRAG